MQRGFRFLVMVLLVVTAAACSDDDPVAPQNDPPENEFPDNNAPELPALADVDATVGKELLLNFQATDPDGDVIRYHLVVRADSIRDPLPQAGIDSETGDFHFTPLARDMPFRSFIVEVDDGKGGEDSSEFKVLITE